MATGSPQEITQLLLAWSEGDLSVQDKLVPLVYAELHRLAHYYMGHESAGHLLQTTALVNEAYLRLIDQREARWQNRAQFFGISAHLMRRILVDMARSRGYQKRGGQINHVSLEDALVVSQERHLDLMALDDALTSLAAIDSRKAQVVELRFFGGLGVEETAEILKVSSDTVTRDWITARAWLYSELSRESRKDDA